MIQLTPNKAAFWLSPGSTQYLKGKADPDALMNKLLINHQTTRKIRFKVLILLFCWAIAFIMVGYAWRMHHDPAPPAAEHVKLYYPGIAIDLTTIPHKKSMKYKTHPHIIR